MQTKIYDAQSIKMEFDLLAAELRANLVDEVEYRERRKKLYERAHEAIKSECASLHNPATCFFCIEEATERRAKMDGSLLVTAGCGQKSEKRNGISI